MTTSDTRAAAQAQSEDLVALRRRLHRHPEIGLDLPGTQAAVLDALTGLDLEVTTGAGLSSVTAVLRGRTAVPGAGRDPVLLRADMDALPVTEQLDLDYASQVPGSMHACGHDLHVAGLVGAARILHARRDELAGDVVLMFQPGEEGPGGAEPMIREGVLDAAGRRVGAAYALHVSASPHPLGTWFSRPGPLMAAADECVVTLTGAGGHGSQPQHAKDPVPAACALVLGLQTMVTREFDVFDPVVLTVGHIAAGTKENIIPDTATLEMTIRTFSAVQRRRVHAAVTRVVEGTAAAHGLAADVLFRGGYPVTRNDETEYDLARQAAVDLFGADRYLEMPDPECGAEDFGFVADLVPSAYLYLSARAGGRGDAEEPATAPDNHSPRAAFDDSVVPDAAALLAECALRRLAP